MIYWILLIGDHLHNSIYLCFNIYQLIVFCCLSLPFQTQATDILFSLGGR